MAMAVSHARRIVGRLGALAVLLTLCGCDNPSGGVGGSAALQTPPPKMEMPSEEACRQWAKQLEDAVAQGNADAFNASFDWDTFLKITMRGFEDATIAREAFRRGFNEGMNSPTGLAATFCANPSGKVKYHLLRLHDADGQRYALFRAILPEGGVNYHDHVLSRQADGRAKSVDLFAFLSGEKLSETFRRLFVQALSANSKSLLNRFTGRESEFVASFEKIEQMTHLVHAGQYREAIDVYDTLPASVQKEKMVLLVRMGAAMHLDAVEYLHALADLRRYCAHDPSSDLIMIDQFFLKREFTKARECLDRLDKAIGGDPYLDVLRAKCYLEEEQYHVAKQLASRARTDTDVTQDAYWVLATVSLRQHDYDETSRLLNVLQRDCGVEIGDLTTVPEYAEFVKSPQYQKWLEEQPKP